MAGRRGAGDGILAGAVARADVRRVAGVLGAGLRAVRPGLRLPVRDRLEAWHKGYGWRGMLILGVLPALACVWIRIYVKEPEVWTENKKIQNATQKQVTLPLFAIFKPKYLYNTLTGCLWMAANFCVYYAVWAMLGTYLTKGTGLDAGPGGGPGVLGQHPHVRRLRLLGRDVGTRSDGAGR